LQQELLKEDGAYRQIQMSKEEVLELQKPRLVAWKLWSKEFERLGYLYEIPKFHKNPIGHRYIAGCSSVSTILLARVLVKALHFILNVLREKDDEHIKQTGIRRFFVINNFEEVTSFLSKWSAHSFSSMKTGDFSTLYTTIPLDDLVSELSVVINEAWVYHAQNENILSNNLYLRVGHTVGWVKKRRPDLNNHCMRAHDLSCTRLVEMVSFLIMNTYLCNGNQVYQQVVGIPMGTNPGPDIANLYLYAKESAYMDSKYCNLAENVENRIELVEEGQSFHMTFRYIDDTFSIDNPLWDQVTRIGSEDGGIYPKGLVYMDTSVSNMESHFLGLHLKISDRGKISSNIYDKRKDFAFPVQRYPDMQSFIPKSVVYGVCIGLWDRAYKICSSPMTFLYHAIDIANTMISKGCLFQKLFRLFRNYFSSRSPLKWKHISSERLLRKFKNISSRFYH
jgi:hypothetical protein